MKRKNGFTLVELLVVIALMLSILGIAIVSLISASNNKKRESWNLVKTQIETAAVEYFTANEYLFEGLSDNSNGTISVSTLIKQDYLNKVTNPTTGKAISNCTVVKIFKSNKRISATLDETSLESSNTCDTDDSIVVSETRSPKYNLKSECNFNNGNNESDGANHKSEWCYQYKTSIEFISDESIDKLNVKYCIGNSSCNPNMIVNKNLIKVINTEDVKGKIVVDSIIDDGSINGVSDKNRYITFRISNDIGSSVVTTSSYNLDRNEPSGTFKITSASKEYFSYKTNFDLKLNDNQSGLYSAKYNHDDGSVDSLLDSSEKGKLTIEKQIKDVDITDNELYDGKVRYPVIILQDNVGNISEIKGDPYTTYKECSNTISETQTETGSCDCDTKLIKKTTLYEMKDKITGKTCDITSSEKNESCTPSACDANCPTFDYSDSRNKLTDGFYKDTVYVKFKFPSNIKEYDSYTNYPGTNNYKKWGTYPASDTTGTISGDGKRRIKLVVKTDTGSTKDCYSKWINIDTTAPTCPTIKFKTGTKGNSGWYTSKVVLDADFTSDTSKWEWYKKNSETNKYEYSKTYYTNGLQTLTFDADGNRKAMIIVYDKVGNSRKCYTGTYNIDKTPPKIKINYGPEKEKCGSGSSIRTKYNASDSTSGLKIVKDYYGYNNSIPSVSSSYWRNRSVTQGTSSFSYDHNWGPYCTTKGNPSSGTSYKLKYYLEDVAGNVTTGYTKTSAKY